MSDDERAGRGPRSPNRELWAIVVAGGSGDRFGGRKQLAPLAGRRVIDWAVDGLGCDQRTVVVMPGDEINGSDLGPFRVVAGGESRSASVRAGLAALPASATHVLVHDAARPLAGRDLVARVVQALNEADAVIPVVPVTDTLRHRDGAVVDRSELVAVQTPQGFSVERLAEAHAAGGEATDDAGMVDAIGGAVTLVDGEPTNIKITVETDLLVAEALIGGR